MKSQPAAAVATGPLPVCDGDADDAYDASIAIAPCLPTMTVISQPSRVHFCGGTSLCSLPGDCALREVEPWLVILFNANFPAFKGSACSALFYIRQSDWFVYRVYRRMCIVDCILWIFLHRQCNVCIAVVWRVFYVFLTLVEAACDSYLDRRCCYVTKLWLLRSTLSHTMETPLVCICAAALASCRECHLWQRGLVVAKVA